MLTTHDKPVDGKYLYFLALGALGVVFGDIGTSPLYALRECFFGPHALPVTPANILGVLSLVFWSLIIVISIKYVAFVMRADNKGEGGEMALLALIRSKSDRDTGARWVLVALGVFGAAMLYGDGMITPAISVLSAVEGLAVATPLFKPYIISITVAILIALFSVQKKGTAGIGSIFGPIMLIWFFVLSLLGVIWISRVPTVLSAVNPFYAVDFFFHNHWRGFFTLGTVFLVVTGGEALYADMGHFGRKPIKLAWFILVLPALLLNYFGQGALLISDPKAASFPFYKMAPEWALYPLVVLATAATVIASQALISGAFSLTRQAVQLGFSPRMKIAHTSSAEVGQIYIPAINWGLMVSCIILVLTFRSSSNLAAAYGIAVTGAMAITTLLFYAVTRWRWNWSAWKAIPLAGFFLIVDLSFFGANVVKIPRGGWVPLVIAGVIFLIMRTWKKGRVLLLDSLYSGTRESLEPFLDQLENEPPLRVSGTAVFMSRSIIGVPPALLHNLRHNKILHEKVIFLTIQTADVPSVEEEDRVKTENLGNGIFRIIADIGFIESPSIERILEMALKQLGQEPVPFRHITFFLGSETIFATREREGMAVWREHLFALMSRNQRSATSFFSIPRQQVVEMGVQVEI